MSDTENKDPKGDTSKDKFKDTVFLPKTEFPMRGNLPEKEPAMVEKWQKMDLYAKIREASKDKPKWILHDGPPYANGDIHMGHALNKILKDVINKSWQMMGYNAPYVPGWDCHGLPIEWKVEESYRKAGKDKDEVDPIQFRGECRDFAQKWVDIQSAQFQTLGVIGDWKDPYLTMTKHGEAQIAREIHKFLNNGGLYRGVKPVMWSTVEQTALAEAEVEYKEHKSVTVWIKFPIIETPIPELGGAYIVIWTTTPWTLPSNRAVAFGTDIMYGLYEHEGQKIVLAQSLANSVFEKLGYETAPKPIASALGMEWFGCEYGIADEITTRCAHPLAKVNDGYTNLNSGLEILVLSGDFVTEENGTGFVHIAPGHGADDFHLVNLYNVSFGSELKEDGRIIKHSEPDKKIEITDNVTNDGLFREHVPLFGGDVIYDQDGKMGNGNFTVIKAMNEANALLAKGSLRHEYPHSWRSKAPVIFRTTPQWFISMDNELGLRKTALQAIKDTNWVPKKGEARINAMIEGRPDWCISRQRAWGVPIALFIDKKTNEPLKDDDVNTRITDAFEEHGADAWWSMNAQDFLGDKYKADDYEQIFDIVDVWFESGSTHTFVVDDREELNQQADLYLEGSDQHRGWFHSSLLEACGTKGHAPYKNVLTHGFVLDEKGYKMSKSDGNVVDPLKLMKQSGADILRLWTMTSDYAEDIRIGKDTMKNTSDLYRRIRNTLRFLLGSLEGLNKSEMVDLEKLEELPELEQLVLHQLHEMDQKIRGHIKDHNYSRMAKELHEFCNQNLSAFYFDIRKDRLYCDDPSSFERRATRSVMAHTYNCLVSWLAPILSFTAEEAWSQRPTGVFEEAESIHLREFASVPDNWKNEALAKKWDSIKKVKKVVQEIIEPLRADKQIGSSLEAYLTIYTSPHIHKVIKDYNFEEICIVSQANLIQNDEVPIDAYIFNTGNSETVSIVAGPATEGEKCLRCWKVLPEVSDHVDHICNRCDNVVNKKQAA